MTTQKVKRMNLDPRKLEAPPVRITSAFEDEVFVMFQDDVKEEGIEEDLQIAVWDGHYYIVNGLHRRDEALRLGLPTVPCKVREMDLKQIQMRNLAQSTLHGKTKTSEVIKVVGDLYTNHGATIDDIIAKTRMSRERLETMIKISEAHPDVLRELDEDHITFGQAGQIVRFKDRVHQHRMLMSVRQYHPKIAELKVWVDEALVEIEAIEKRPAGTGPRQPPAIPTAQCACCLQMFPYNQLTNVTLDRGCYSLLIQAHEVVQKQEATAARQEAAKGTPYAGPAIAPGGGT